MHRTITLLGIVATAGVLAFVMLNVFMSPTAARREQLVKQLADVPAMRVEVGPLATRVDIDAVQQSITGKESLWKELVPPPPPPPPPPEPAPDLAVMLKDVQPTRQRVGDAIRIITPENARGGRYSVGDAINGVTIKEITPTTVVFEYVWKDKVLTHKLPRK